MIKNFLHAERKEDEKREKSFMTDRFTAEHHSKGTALCELGKTTAFNLLINLFKDFINI